MKYILVLAYTIIYLMLCNIQQLIKSYTLMKAMHSSMQNPKISRYNRLVDIRRISWQFVSSRLKMIHSNAKDISSINSWKVSIIKGGIKGIIKEQPKKGWYSIQLLNDQNELVNKIHKARITDFEIVETAFKLAADHVKDNNSLINTLQDNVALDLKSTITLDALPIVVKEGNTEYSIPVINPPSMHLSCKDWIIFSDLHVKGASIDICEEVLSQVHKAAKERNAGIIFLGDFWHVRGSLIVDLLNRVLKELRKWTQPVIMIPGNHDQVSLGGTVHALEPLLYAFRPDQIIMINEPSICMGALWIPYRRDPQIMKSVLDRVITKKEEVSMIFCHADVKGAYMNDGMRSSEGLDINIFPPNMPIFSGHFHKPHTITKNKSTLRYVGSPYQTSLSEAGQEKYFYCVRYDDQDDRHNLTPEQPSDLIPSTRNSQSLRNKFWREIERWPISIGSKIIKASSLDDPLIKTANPGDRVVISVPIGQDFAAQKLVDELQLNGISNVELRPEQNPLSIRRLLSSDSDNSTSTITQSFHDDSDAAIVINENETKIEDMNPVRIFQNYLEDFQNLTKTNENEVIQNSILSDGILLIEKLMGTSAVTASNDMSETTSASSSSSSAMGKVHNLKLHHVKLSNFGPYADSVHYPLSKRGLVLLKGQSSDGTGADSNGSGKTTLAMSVMWALTGSLDARLVGDNRPTDVAFDASVGNTKASIAKNKSKLTAEVSLFGTINDKSFEIIRRRSSKKTELFFTVNGNDLTTQSVKDTQVLIDQMLGIGKGLIERCCFFGQHTHTLHSLLGLTDVKLKNELSNLVDTSIWISAVHDVRNNEKQLKARNSELNIDSKLRNEEILKTKNYLNDSISVVNRLQNELNDTQQAMMDLFNASDTSMILNAKEKDKKLKIELLKIEDSMKFLRSNKLDPLRIELRGSSNSSLIDIDKKIEKNKLEIAKLKSEQSTFIISIQTIQQKLQNLTLQTENLSKTIDDLNENLKLDLNLSFNPQDYYSKYEIHLKNLTTINIKIDETNSSLLRLNELKINKDIVSNNKEQPNNHHSKQCQTNNNTNKDYECPTCGQEMPSQSREQRYFELTNELKFLKNKQALITKDSQLSRKQYDSSLNIKASIDQRKTLIERMNELNLEEKAHNLSLKNCISQIKTLEIQLDNELKNKLLIESEIIQIQNRKVHELEESEKEEYELEVQKKNILYQIDEIRREVDEKLNIRNSFNTKISLLQERIAIAETLVKERQDNINSLYEVIHQNDETIKELINKLNVLDRLEFILGPKGIQNYVFQSVILQLESIANGYLMILADGGIQLSLQGDLDDTERIVKSVLIRSKGDSQYRERSLSQLSGGQWRRVSLALDFAFAELIRRRGILRCNVMVMDEVLTHLDASGREAVGTVLRCMVGNNNDHLHTENKSIDVDNTIGEEINESSEESISIKSDTKNIKDLKGWLFGGGNYETVIVILQDLAAAELEESFDHIDVVVKETDTSAVIIDGVF